MNQEQVEAQTIEKPDWFPEEASEVEERPDIVWSCYGEFDPDLFRAATGKTESWDTVFPTAEEAEAHSATEPGPGWRWDRQPASNELLLDALKAARFQGRLGVRIKAFRNGQWITLREYPAGEPLL